MNDIKCHRAMNIVLCISMPMIINSYNSIKIVNIKSKLMKIATHKVIIKRLSYKISAQLGKGGLLHRIL